MAPGQSTLSKPSPRGKYFSLWPFVRFPLKVTIIIFPDNYRTRDQTSVLKAQKMLCIQTVVAQEKHPQQHLSLLTLPSLRYRKIAKSAMRLVCDFQ